MCLVALDLKSCKGSLMVDKGDETSDVLGSRYGDTVYTADMEQDFPLTLA